MVRIQPLEAQRSIPGGSAPNIHIDQSVAQGLGQLGQSVSDLGQAEQRIQLRAAEMQQTAARFRADQDLRALEAQIDTDLEVMQGTVDDPSGEGLVARTNKVVSEKYRKFQQSLPASLQAEYGPILNANAVVRESQAVKATVATQQAWYLDGLTKQLLEHAAVVSSDPTLFEEVIRDFDQSVDRSGLWPSTAKKLKEEARIQLGTAKAGTEIEIDPIALQGKLGINPVGGDPFEAYYRAAESAESGGDPDAANPSSSALGLFQFTDGTWASVSQAHPELGLTPNGRTDPDQQRRAMKALTEDNGAILAAAGLPVTPATLYSAHFLGAGGATTVLKAPDNAALAGYVDPAVIAANPFLEGMTIGDFRAWATRKMGSATLDPAYAALPYDTRRKLYDAAAIAGRVNIETAVTDAPAAIQATGQYDKPMPTIEQFTVAYGPQDGLDRYSKFTASVEVAELTHSMQTMPAAEIAALVQSAVPTSTGDGAALEAARYQALAAAADATMKARTADPAGYTVAAFPEIAQAWREMQQPGGYERALALTQTAQQSMGISEPVLLPKAMADDAIKRFADIEATEDARAEAIASLILNAGSAEQQRAIFRQLLDAGLPEHMAGVLDAMVRGDQGGAQRLLRAALVDPSKLPGTAPETTAKINEAIQSGLMAPGTIGDVFYGLSDGDALNFQRALQDQQLITNAVQLRIRAGEPLDQAVAAVGRDLFGDVVPVTGRNVSVLVDAGSDGAAIQTGFQQLLPAVKKAMTLRSAVPPGVTTADSSKAIFTAAEGNQVEAILAEGYFRNAGDGFVFIDPYTGTAIEDAAGQPLSFSLDQVLAAAGTAPVPVDPMDAERDWLELQSQTFGIMGGAAQ